MSGGERPGRGGREGMTWEGIKEERCKNGEEGIT